MLARTKYALIIGFSCVLTAVAYAGLAEPLGYAIEWAGVTMLAALGVALGIMVAVLDTGPGN